MSELLSHSVLCRQGRAVMFVLLCMLVGGWPASAPSVARADQGLERSNEGDHMPGRPAAWDVVADAAIAPPNQAGARIAAAATDCLGFPTRRIRYTSDGVIHLEG